MNPLMFTVLFAGRCDKLNVGSRSRSLNLLVYANRNAISIIFVEKDKKKKETNILFYNHFVYHHSVHLVLWKGIITK